MEIKGKKTRCGLTYDMFGDTGDNTVIVGSLALYNTAHLNVVNEVTDSELLGVDIMDGNATALHLYSMVNIGGLDLDSVIKLERAMNLRVDTMLKIEELKKRQKENV